jgi:hypothetical protein
MFSFLGVDDATGPILTGGQDLLQTHLRGALADHASAGRCLAGAAGIARAQDCLLMAVGGRGSCARAELMLLRAHRIPLQLLHQLLAILRVD